MLTKSISADTQTTPQATPRSKGDSLRARGFTLIELLVAITILSIVAVLGWRGLDGIVRARIALNAQLEQTRGMQLTFAQMQSDCAHIVPGSTIPGRAPLSQAADRLTLVRTVLVENQPTGLQVVSYRLSDGRLTRRESALTRDLDELDKLEALTTNDASSAQEVVLQTGVSSMTIRAWIKGVGWTTWRPETDLPTAGNANGGAPIAALPTGLEVSLLLQGSDARMTKIFLLGPV
jgi:general secretion pathway protein J